MQQPASPAVQDRNTLVLQYYPMVRQVAYRIARRLPQCVDADDLVNIGVLGLIDAVDRYEAGRAPSFEAYARIRVQGAILDEMRRNDWVPRSVRDRASKLERVAKELTTDLGRPPNEEELAAGLEVTVERLRELRATADVRVLISTEDGSDENNSVADTLAHPEMPLDELIAKRHFSARIRGVLDHLPERERLIVDLYYYRDLTFKEIAGVLGVTESRVSQLHSRMKRRIRENLIEVMAS